MSVIVLDDCLTELYEAEKCLDMIQAIDSYSEIFEASSDKVKETVENNEKATNGAIAHLKNAANAILNMIRNIIDSIKEFFQKRKMDSLEREAYDAFKKAAKEDPSLKNKKVTVTDFRKLKSEYNNIIKEVEEYDKALASGKKNDVQQLADAITNRLAGIAKGVSVSVSCDTALKMATSSRELAQMMLHRLQEDEKLQQILVDSIGKKQAKQMEKDLKSLGKRLSLKRHWMKKHGQMCDSVDEAVYKTFEQVKNLCTNPSLKNVSDNKTIIKGALGNKEVKDTLKDAKDIASYSAGTAVGNEVKRTIKRKFNTTKKAVKDKIAPGDYNDRSAFDAIVGVDNPNGVFNKTAEAVGRKKAEFKAKRELKKQQKA